MNVFSDNEYIMFENSIGDLHLCSVPDRGFYQSFGMSPKLHAHSYYEILFSTQGEFFVDTSDGTVMEVGVGDLCLIPPGHYHGTRAGSENSQKLALRFHYSKRTDSRGKESVYVPFHRAMSACYSAILITQNREMSNLLALLQREILSCEPVTREYIQALLSQFYILLLRRWKGFCKPCMENGDSDTWKELEQRRLWVEEYFQEFYAHPITEEHMAARMNLSKRQVSRVLKELYGKSFRQLLIDERLNCAAQLLMSTEQSVDEIAASVGYTSISGFYSAFRQRFGVSAGRYRREILKSY